jgi:ribosomal protein S18 acetylase RimI-like enzyme
MEEYSWVPSPPTSDLTHGQLLAIRDLLAAGTDEYYALAALYSLPISSAAGSLILIDSKENIKGVLWSMIIDENTVRILAFCINSDLQNIGLGTQAWNEFAILVKSKGKSTVYLEVKAENEGAINFYRKVGLNEIAILSKYYHSSIGIIMQGNL